MAERDIQQAIRAALGMDMRIILWRNNTGKMQVHECPKCHAAVKPGSKHCEECGATFARPERRFIHYGLCVGSSDLIGVLRTDGRFVALEVKTPTGTATPEQEMFIHLVRNSGGFACVVRSVDEAKAAVERAVKGECE